MNRAGTGRPRGLLDAEVGAFAMATVGVATAALLAMAASLPGPFLFDDVPLIQGNTRVHSLEHLDRLLAGELWDTNFTAVGERQSRGFWRPLVLVGYALNWVVGGGDALWFHVVNLALHAANSVLVAFALRRWTGSEPAAVTGAVLFAVHPVQVETVAWIAGRTDSMCLLGLLVAATGYALRLRRRGLSAVALEVGGALFALGSKESFVVLPVLLAFESWAADGRPPLAGAKLRRFVRDAAPHLVVVGLYAAAHATFVREEVVALGVTAGNRAPLVLEAVGRYASLVAWPDDLTLGRALFTFRDGVIAPRWGLVALGAAAVATGGALAWRCRDSRPAVSIALLGSFALLAPVSGIFWLDYDVLVSPRFLYVPATALAFVAAAAVAPIVSGRERPLGAALLVLGLVLGARSAVRAADFSSTDRFWRAEIERNPRYTSAQLHFIGREMQNGRPHSALALAHGSFATLARAGDPELARAGLVLPILHALSQVTADVERDALEQIARFVDDVLAARDASLVVPRFGLDLRVAGASAMGPTLRLDEHRLRGVRAAALSRLERDDDAIAALVPALDGCPDCWTLMTSALPVALRAGRFDVADRILEAARPVAPPRVHAELVESARVARELTDAARAPGATVFDRIALGSATGAHGRAYRLGRLEHARDPSPRAALGLAELAAFAGDVQRARQLYAEVASADEIEARIVAIERLARRRDAPIPDDYWVPRLD